MAELPPAGQYTANLVAIHHANRMAAPMRRGPKPLWPRAIEQDYGTALVRQVVDRMRKSFEPLVRELPRMLARVQAQRGDAAAIALPLDQQPAPVRTETFAGFPIVIENPAGSLRCWTMPNGITGATVMKFDYGYIAGAVGADGEDVDVYLGPDERAPWVYVVHQMRAPNFDAYDEDKVMIGFASADAARAAYVGQYDDDRFFGGMSQLSVQDFRQLLAEHDGGMLSHGVSRIRGGEDYAPDKYDAWLASVRGTRLDAYRLDGEILVIDGAAATTVNAWLGARAARMDAGEADYAKGLIDRAETQWTADIPEGLVSRLVRFFADRITRQSSSDLAKQLTAQLGFEVQPDDRYVPALIEHFSAENASLIGSIPRRLHDEVAQLTARAFTKRMHPDTFAELLQDRFDIAENRARLIARDQIGTLNSQLNGVRQRGLGVTHYYWLTRRDDKVRPEHRKRDGKRIAWDDPPADGHAGEPIACRCLTQPDLEPILKAAAERARG